MKNEMIGYTWSYAPQGEQKDLISDNCYEILFPPLLIEHPSGYAGPNQWLWQSLPALKLALEKILSPVEHVLCIAVGEILMDGETVPEHGLGDPLPAQYDLSLVGYYVADYYMDPCQQLYASSSRIPVLRGIEEAVDEMNKCMDSNNGTTKMFVYSMHIVSITHE